MSTEIDNKVVQMQFDNAKFEKNVDTSLNTIDKLKKSLNFDGSVKSLSSLQSAADKMSLGGIAASLDTLTSKFSSLGIVGMSAINNITNTVMNASTRMLKALTVDPVSTGLNEYETKINAITTILTNTASKGTTLDQVNETLAELNDYADKTIYNFAEMTKNIGTFTAAGIGLKESASAIKGIANLAAGSGSTSQQASTAMYQLSQALAAGSLKLQDWNSVVNAGMGGELFQNALKKTAKELGVFVDESVPFRESLKDGWITTEVLTKTLSEFAKREDLLNAATQVKTFTQLFDTMKESIQSGWAVSWENIIGDREQAVELLTNISNAFNNLIGPSTDARNATLKFWNEFGGRQAMIDGITNVIKVFANALKPIGQAWKEVFPPGVGYQLVKLSKAFKAFTERLYISGEASDNIKTTFKGLFSLINIGVQVISAIIRSLGMFKGLLPAIATDFLRITSFIASFIVKLSETTKATDIFFKIIKTGQKIIQSFIKLLVLAGFAAYQMVDGLIQSLGGMDTIASNIENFFGNIKVSILGFYDTIKKNDKIESFKGYIKSLFPTLETFNDLGTSVKDKFTAVWKSLEPFINILKAVGTKIKEIAVLIKDGIIKSLTGFDSKDFQTLFDAGFLAGFLIIAKNVAGAFKSWSNVIDSFKTAALKISKSVVGVLDELGGVLKAYQNGINAEALKKIAIAVAILAASLIALSFVPADKMMSSIAGITGLFANLAGAFVALTKFSDLKGSAKFTALAVGMIGMSVAIGLLASTVLKLQNANPIDLAKGLGVITVLIAELMITAVALSKMQDNMIKSSIGLNAFALAIGAMVKIITNIGSVPVETLAQGMIGLTVIFMELTALLAFSKKSTMSTGMGVGILAMAAALHVIYLAMVSLGQMKPEELGQGIKALTLIMGMLTIMSAVLSFGKGGANAAAVGVGVVIMSAALFILAKALREFVRIPASDLQDGVVALAGLLGFMTIMLYALNATPVLAAAVALLAVSGSIYVIAQALNVMSKIPSEKLQDIMLGLAIGLAAITAAALAMQAGVLGAIGLVAISGALMLLVPTLTALGLLPWEVVKQGLIVLAASLGALVVAGLLLQAVIPGLIVLSGFFLSLGVAAALFGVGVSLVGAGILTLASGIAILITAVTNGAEAMPIINQAFVSFVQTIKNNMPLLVDTFVKGLKLLIAGLVSLDADIRNALLTMLLNMLIAIRDKGPDILNTFLDIILQLLTVLQSKTEEFVTLAVGFIVAFINGISNKIGDVIDAAFNFVISFINGFADALENNADRIYEAMENLGIALIEFFLKGLKKMADVEDNMKKAFSSLMDSIKISIDDKVDDAEKAIGDLIASLIKIIIDSVSQFVNAGKDVVDGFVNGIKDNVSAVGDSAKDLGNAALKTVKKMLEINSPSAVFDWLGKMLGLGFENGITGGIPGVTKASDNLGMAAIPDTNKYSGEASIAGEGVGASFADAISKSMGSNSGGVANASKDLAKTMYDAAVEVINDRKYYNKLTLQEELEAYQNLQNQYVIDSEYYKKAAKEVYRVQNAISDASYQNSINWIDERKYYNELSLKEELAAWTRVQKRYDKDTDERKKVDREIYRVKKEMTERQEQIDKDYYDNTKAINDKLEQDIKDLNQTYKDSVDSRAKSLYDSYGLFEEVAEKDPLSGLQLIVNLQDQVDEFESWQRNIQALVDKGVSQGLIDELTEMGPKAVAEIQALNRLSTPELNRFVELWQIKNKDAREQAVKELEPLRQDTLKAIDNLNVDAEKELDKYKQMWIDQTSELTGEVVAGVNTITEETVKAVTNLKTEVGTAMTEVTEGVKTTVNTTDWEAVGKNIVQGLANGIKKNKSLAITEAAKMAAESLFAAKKKLGVESPSKEFEAIGKFSVEGFVNGIYKLTSKVVSAGQDLGNSALTSAKKILTDLDTALNMDVDMSPTIKPVIDISNIQSGLATAFANQSLDVSTTARQTAAIANRATTTGEVSGPVTNNKVENDIVINVVNNVRNDSDINKINENLDSLLTRYSNAKGVPA